MNIIKYSEKILIWLHREDKTLKWLGENLDQTRQSISQKVKTNSFTDFDKMNIKRLGFKE